MNITKFRKKWKRPKLIILLRNKPDGEWVLTACKGGIVSGPTDDDNFCLEAPSTGCNSCDEILIS